LRAPWSKHRDAPEARKLAASDKGSAAAEWHRFSPDEQFLYVSNSEPQKTWMRYRVKADGTLTEGELFFDATSDPREGGPTGSKSIKPGICTARDPAACGFFLPRAKHCDDIMPERVANLNWGGSDGKSLYITASSSVYRIDLRLRECGRKHPGRAAG